ncbi:MAG: tripartite-type tricarboxylate transporter receptor subunit TctC [Alphaproteobacteria bacterium]|jgi:tripartite-type tricarboxylate transporter receptor subunit TctC
MTRLKHVLLSVTAATVFAGGSTIAQADAISDFYKIKRIQIIVGSGAGGGYDTYARMVGRQMGRHIPGKPRFTVKNQPGAGSVVAANFIYNVAPQDGTVIGAVQRNIPFLPIFGDKGPRYDPVKINWLGSLNSEVGVFAVWKANTKVRTFADIQKTEVIFGGTGPNDTEIFPSLANNTLGTKIKIITGYPGSTVTELAMQRGEVQGYTSSFSSLTSRNRNWRNDFVFLAQNALKAHPALIKMNIPLIIDYVKDPEHLTIWRLLLVQKLLGRPFMMGPKVPADRLKVMQTAFEAMVKDPKFLAEADKQKREIIFVSGDEIKEKIVEVAAAPKSIIAKMDAYTRYKGKKVKAKVELAKHTGKVTALKKGGRQIVINYKGKKVMAKVSGSRTKITVGGKEAARKAVKIGMTCTFTYPSAGSEAKKVDCKN